MSREMSADIDARHFNSHDCRTSNRPIALAVIHKIIYVAAKATYIRLLYGKRGFFGPSSVKRGRTHIVLG